MAQKRLKIPFPLGGISDAVAESTQFENTTRDALNCRGRDARTGRIRGAQRPGLSQFSPSNPFPFDADDNTVTSPTRDLAAINYDIPRIDWTRLLNWVNEDITDPDMPQSLWTAGIWHRTQQGDGSAFSPAVDLSGNIFVITEGRMIHKYSPDGELVESIAVPAETTDSVVRRVQVDPLNNVYCVVASGGGAAGGQLLRFEPDDDVGYKLRYSQTLNARPKDFKLKFNTLYMIVKRSTGLSYSSIQAWGALDANAPVLMWDRFVPHPCHGLDIGPGGHLFITCPANANRLTAPEVDGFTAGAVGWTPNEMWRSAARIHTWLDAYYMPDIQDGDDVAVWEDATYFVPSVIPEVLSVFDTQARSPYMPFSEPELLQGRWRPTYAAAGMGGKPCVHFEGLKSKDYGMSSAGDLIGQKNVGCGLGFLSNSSGLNRQYLHLDAADPREDAQEAQTSLIPGSSSVGSTIFLVLRLGDEGYSQGVFHLNSIGNDKMRLALLANCRGNNQGGVYDAGKLVLVGWNDATLSSNDNTIQGFTGDNYPWTKTGDVDSLSRAAIVTIHFPGPGDTSNTKGEFRVNGRLIDSFQYNPKAGHYNSTLHNSADPADQIKGAMLGAPFVGRLRDENNGSENRLAFFMPQYDSVTGEGDGPNAFDGDIAEVLTVLAHTQPGGSLPDPSFHEDSGHSLNYSGDEAIFEGVNSEAVINNTWEPTWIDGTFTGGSDNYNMAGGVGGLYRAHRPPTYSGTPSGSPATEIELIEGYLAHKWGLANALVEDHPFHGVGNLPGDFGTSTHSYDPITAFGDWGVWLDSSTKALISPQPIIAKYDANNGNVLWCASCSGVGFGVIADEKGGVYAVGEPVTDTASEYANNPTTGDSEPNMRIRKILDLGTSFSALFSGESYAWAHSNDGDGFETPASTRVDLTLDHKGDTLFVPTTRGVVMLPGGLAVNGKHPGSEQVIIYNTTDGSRIATVPMPENLFIPNPSETKGLHGADSWRAARDLRFWQQVEFTGDDTAETLVGYNLTNARLRMDLHTAANPQTGEQDVHSLYEIGAPARAPRWHTSASTYVIDGSGRFSNILFPFDQDSNGAKQDTAQGSNSNVTAQGRGPSQEMVDRILDFKTPHSTLGGWSIGSHLTVESRTRLSRAPDWSYEAAHIVEASTTDSSSIHSHTYISAVRINSNTYGSANPDGRIFIASVFIKHDAAFEGTSPGITLELGQQPKGYSGYRSGFVNRLIFLQGTDVAIEDRAYLAQDADHGSTDFGCIRSGTPDENGNYWWRVWVAYTFETAGIGESDDDIRMTFRPTTYPTTNAQTNAFFAWLPTVEILNASGDIDHVGAALSAQDPADGPRIANTHGGGGNGPYGVGNAALTPGAGTWATYLAEPNTLTYSQALEGRESQVYWPIDALHDFSPATVWWQFWAKEIDLDNLEPGRVDGGSTTAQFLIYADYGAFSGSNHETERAEFYINLDVSGGSEPYATQGGTSSSSESGVMLRLNHSAPDYNDNPTLTWPYPNNLFVRSRGDGWCQVGVYLRDYLGHRAGGTTNPFEGEAGHNPDLPGGIITSTDQSEGDLAHITNKAFVQFHPSPRTHTATIGNKNGVSVTNYSASKFVVYTHLQTWGHQLFVNPELNDEGFPTDVYYDPGLAGPTGIAKPLFDPDYDRDAEIEADELTRPSGPEHIWITTQKTAGRVGPNLRKHRLVAAEPKVEEGEVARSTRVLSVVDGTIFVVNPDESGYTVPTGGRDALSPDSLVSYHAIHFGKVYFADGVKYAVYDPIKNEVSKFAAKEGELPPRAKLITSYRGRLVLARTPEDPHNYYMSRIGDPEDWNFYPPFPNIAQALSGTTIRAGKSSDVINALIPFNDDLMLLGGDSTILRMTGDPAAGGQMDTITSSIGIAFGKAWCMDPEGMLFFLSPVGRVYGMEPGGMPQELSNSHIGFRLRSLDLTQYAAELVWSTLERGLHIFLLPRETTGGASAPICLFWEKETNAWWVDGYHEERTPYAVTTLDGMRPDDRKIVFGNYNGKLLYINPDRDTDLAKKIQSHVVIPIVEPQDSELTGAKVTGVHTVMGASTRNAGLLLQGRDDPTGEAQASTSDPVPLLAGRSNRLPLRLKGNFLEFRISNEGVDDSLGYWSVEELRIDLAQSGRRRNE